jgi:uncharacterized protein YndB with AHSA1/START domain
MQRDIRQVWFFEHSPETVWEFLTTSELLAQWLMENDFKPIPGHQFKFITKPKFNFGFDGIVYCEVVEITPLKKLSYTWKGGPGKGVIKLDSLVTWTLTPKNNGTELLLEHTGFKGIKNYVSYLVMDKGWKYKIKKRFQELLIQLKK